MKWLQFSDLHLSCSATGTDTILLRRQLLAYLKETIGVVDNIFLTGDYFYCGQYENVEEICQWIREIASAVGIENVAEQVYMVPGNHDVKRAKERKYIIEGAEKEYKASEGRLETEIMESLLKDFSYYDELFQKMNQYSYTEESIRRGNPHNLKECEEFNLLMLNTALLSYTDEERGNLRIGNNYVAELIPENSKPMIVLAHHGLEMMEREEQRKLEQIFRECGVKLYLCGDAHELDCRKIRDTYYQLVNGCLRDSDGKVDITFTAGEIIGGEIRIKSHEWKENWAPNLHFGNKGMLVIRTGEERGIWDGKWNCLEKGLKDYLAKGILKYEDRDIPIHTPQVLLLLLRYPGSVAYQVLNEYRTNKGEPFGEYLCQLLDKEDKQYEKSDYHFNKGFSLDDILGLKMAEAVCERENRICITENILFYSIMEEEKSRTVQELKKRLGTQLFEEMKQKIKRNATPAPIEFLE